MQSNSIRSRYVMAGRVRTHYSEAGDSGAPLVLLHGGGAGSSGEAGFGKVMPALAQHFVVYAPDGVGGYGDTDPSVDATEGLYSRLYQLMDFVDTLCLDRFYLAGNSMGAWVAARYALEHPDRVRKMVLISSNSIAGAMGLKVPVTDAMRALQSYDGTEQSMRRVMEALIADPSLVSDELVALRTAAANRPGAAAARAAFDQGQKRLLTDPDLRLKFNLAHTLPHSSIPSMFIWGEEDRFAPPSIGRELERMLARIPFTFVPRAGHQVQTEQPDTVAKLMINFFTG